MIVQHAEKTMCNGLENLIHSLGINLFASNLFLRPKSSKTVAPNALLKLLVHAKFSKFEVYQFLCRVLVHTPRQNGGWAMSKVDITLTKS
jgi:hypothetical protein